MARTKRKTTVKPFKKTRVTYELRSGLFGLLNWWEESKCDSYQNVIYIETDTLGTEVWLNGERLVPEIDSKPLTAKVSLIDAMLQ